MSRRHDVAWSESARVDVLDIFEYLLAESLPAAEAFADEIEKLGASLATMPERGRTVPELREEYGDTYREVIVPPHRLVYRVKDRTVYIVAVVDGRRDLARALMRMVRRG
jgi:plasmid stabilization system protein ParE